MSQIAANEPLTANPEPTPKTGRSERSRAAILDAAFDFLWSQPFRDATVNSPMSRTDISRSCFYRHCQSIHELMKTLLEMQEAEILDGATSWLAEDGNPVATLHEGLAENMGIRHRRGPFLKAVSDAAGADARMEKAWTDFLARYDVPVTQRIEADTGA